MARHTSPDDPVRSFWLNAALLLLILVAFARITWNLGAEDLWWDESLSLQRAESALLPLLRNQIVLADGRSLLTSIDQHPFFFFLLQAILLRSAGNDEFVLRFVSDAASTLMVPVAFSFAALYVRRGVFPGTSPAWAALLAAISPFFLWFGQEARPYALWALLALLSTYLLLRATEQTMPQAVRWPWVAGYVATLLMFVTTHYYAVFLLPVHVILIYRAVRSRSRAVALSLAVFILAAGALLTAVAFWFIIVRQAGGVNFRHISWKILLPDLLNAFSLGLSVDISRVLWLDLFFGLLAVAGAAWALRSRNTWTAAGWVPVAMVVVPIAGVLAGDLFHPVYMTARHLSLIGGPFIILVGAGVGLAWLLRPWLALFAALMLVAGSGYSTFNYFTQETYAQDDFSRLAREMNNRLAPGDLVLIKSPFAWRIFSYYLPQATMNGMPGSHPAIDVYGAPLLNQPWTERYAFLDQMTNGPRRIWLLVSGTEGHMDMEGQVERWLDDNRFKLQENTYFSQSSLKSHLYLPEAPVYEAVPSAIQNPADVVFGDRIRLAGYDVGDPQHRDLALPLTLYWQAVTATNRRYKYVVKLVEVGEDGSQRTLSLTEREPYDGAIPTIYWSPGKTIVEYGELPPADWPRTSAAEDAERYLLTLAMYDAETLEQLPVTVSGGQAVTEDGSAAILHYRPNRP
jgi:hypothetical protein